MLILIDGHKAETKLSSGLEDLRALEARYAESIHKASGQAVGDVLTKRLRELLR